MLFAMKFIRHSARISSTAVFEMTAQHKQVSVGHMTPTDIADDLTRRISVPRLALDLALTH